jgi:hypothetical protein
MLPDTFTQHRVESPARARGCVTCTYFHGQFYAAHLLCKRDGGRHVVAVPREAARSRSGSRGRTTSERLGDL